MAWKDPLGMIVNELAAGLQPSGDGGPAVPVRGGRRYVGEEATSTTPAVPGDTPPFVIVRRLSRVPFGEVRTRNRIAVTAFALTPPQASAILLRVGPLLHLAGPRLQTNGVAIYNSREEIGGQPGEDPDTGWSTETSIYIVHATTQAVASAS